MSLTKVEHVLRAYGALRISGLTTTPNPAEIELGLMYHLRNKVGIIGGLNYNTITKRPDVKVGILIKL